MKQNIVVSIVIPVYNEADSLVATLTDLHRVFNGDSSLNNMSLEVVVVNDGSVDDSGSVALKLQTKLNSQYFVIKYIHLTRNFGKEAAVFAGYKYATGDLAGCMDADGQHPPLEMSKMIKELLSSDAQAVIGVRSEQTHKKIGFLSSIFYMISKRLVNSSLTVNGTDFRIMRREVVDEFLLATEHGRVNRDIMDWFGYDVIIHKFKPLKRQAGKATYSFKKLVLLAIDGLLGSGTKPLLAVFSIGLLTFATGLVSLSLTAFSEFVLADPLHLRMTAQGYALLLIVSLFGLVLLVLGVLALYIGRVATEVQGRPHYVVDKRRSC